MSTFQSNPDRSGLLGHRWLRHFINLPLERDRLRLLACSPVFITIIIRPSQVLHIRVIDIHPHTVLRQIVLCVASF